MTLIKLLSIMISVAFVSLFERKILGLSQNRISPNKVSFKGILQPILDAIKLFSKENVLPQLSMKFLFILSPSLSLVIMFLIFSSMDQSMMLSSMFFLILLGLGVYSSLLSGWSSVSKYSSIGMVRSASQTISYEVSMVIIFLPILILLQSFKLVSYLLILPTLGCWFLSIIAELNRAPFDFSEGESELISGFNIEYSSVLFTLLFLSEFGMILFFSLFTSFLLFDSSILASLALFTLILLIRSVYPRFRFDLLMSFTWFLILPISIIYLTYATLL